MLKPGEKVVCLPAHRASDPCTWQALTAVMSHQRVDQACLGGHVGLNILNLGKFLRTRSGDVLVFGIHVHNVDFFL